jgi:hypothetical protein
MLRHLSRHVMANAVAYLALFVALGGTSFAAVSLKRNSVKGKHLSANSVTAPKVKDGSLQLADFGAGQLPSGPKGDRGADGAGGPKGERGDAGAAGERGGAGADGDDGADGSPDTAGQVLAKLVQVDGPASDVNADLVDGQDSSVFARGAAATFARASSVSQGFTWQTTVAPGGRGPALRLVFECPSNLASNGSLSVFNESASTINAFVDNGSLDPGYQRVFAFDVPYTTATAAGGERLTVQVQGSEGLATIEFFSVHRATDCHAQYLYSGASL